MRAADSGNSRIGGGACGRWIGRLFGLVFAVMLVLICPVCAEDAVFGEAYSSFLEQIPEDVAALLPDGIFSEDVAEVGEAAAEMSGFRFLLARVSELLLLELDGVLRLFGRLLSVLVIAAVTGTVKKSIGSDALSRAVELCGGCAVIGTLLSLTGEAVTVVSGFFERLSVLVNGIIPLTGVLYAMGGNVGTATVSAGGMMIFLNVVENLCAATLAPVVGICVAIAVADVFFGGNLRGLGNFVKKVYTYFLGMVMLLLTFSLSVQTSLAAGADGVAMKSAKMLAGRAIPVVGGAVGDTLRTVAGSVAYLKSATGTVGIVAVALLVIPPLLSVILWRLGLIAASAAADLLGCTAEGKLLEAFVTVYGYLLAVMSIAAVAAIFLLTLFVKCSVALA